METNTLFNSEVGDTSLWRKTLKRCEGKFYEEDLNKIKNSNGVKDVLAFVDEEYKKQDSRVLKWLQKVKDFGDQFKAYQKSIDLIFQGTPIPGCLIWGSIRLVLSVSALFDC